MFYAVRKGRKTGIYTEWEECLEQVKGYTDCSYKSFDNIQSAYLYLCGYKNITRYKYSSKKALICNPYDTNYILIENNNVRILKAGDSIMNGVECAIERGIPAVDISLATQADLTDELRQFIKANSLKIKVNVL